MSCNYFHDWLIIQVYVLVFSIPLLSSLIYWYTGTSLISVPVWSVMQTEEWKRAIQFQICRRCLIFCDRKFWWRSQNMTHIPTWHTQNWLKAGWQAWKFSNLEKSSPFHPAWHKSLLWVSPGYITYILQYIYSTFSTENIGFFKLPTHGHKPTLTLTPCLALLFVSPTFTHTAQTWDGKAPVTSSAENRNSISCILMKMH